MMKKAKFLSMLRIYKIQFENNIYNELSNVTQNNTIGYVVDGCGNFKKDGKVISVKSGEMIFIPAGCIYQSWWEGNGNIEFFSIAFNFQNQMADERIYYTLQKINLTVPVDYMQKMYIWSQKDEYKMLARFYAFYGLCECKLEKAERLDSNLYIEKAVQYIEQNYNLDFTIPELAALCNMSESYFYFMFKYYTGKTPVEFRNMVKIIHAAKLLQETDCTVEWISDHLHFCSSAYFRKVFKRITGRTPKEFRKNAYMI